MSAPRISLAWVAVLVIVSVVAFFGYQILKVSFEGKPSNEFVPVPMNNPEQLFPPSKIPPAVPATLMEEPQIVPPPPVVGQSQQELMADEPLQQTPPDVQYSEPVSNDPLEGPIHSDSLFGDNLRHPEQMFEVAPPLGSGRVVASGLGSDRSSQGGNQSVRFAPEMAQNGGEFMSGISAFDGSDGGGIGYSMI
jgi:hypothetical protein